MSSSSFLDRKGPLTVGYGSPNCTGVELEFGTMMGNYYDEPVILVKAAWGGHSLYKLFRSPSAGFPADEVLQKELAQARERVTKNNDKNKRPILFQPWKKSRKTMVLPTAT